MAAGGESSEKFVFDYYASFSLISIAQSMMSHKKYWNIELTQKFIHRILDGLSVLYPKQIENIRLKYPSFADGSNEKFLRYFGGHWLFMWMSDDIQETTFHGIPSDIYHPHPPSSIEEARQNRLNFVANNFISSRFRINLTRIDPKLYQFFIVPWINNSVIPLLNLMINIDEPIMLPEESTSVSLADLRTKESASHFIRISSTSSLMFTIYFNAPKQESGILQMNVFTDFSSSRPFQYWQSSVDGKKRCVSMLNFSGVLSEIQRIKTILLA
jgi:hypothetical protein